MSVRTSVDPGAIPPAAMWICETLRAHGHRAWVVGGCVRDHLLGRSVADWDVCTSARPDAMLKLFPRSIPTGIAHGTLTVVRDRAHYEVTTLRGDGDYADGRRPDAVRFLDDIADDLARRDFTVNAIAYDPLDRALVDPFDGRADLSQGCLRAVGDPRRRFAEDGLRVLRGARFVATLGFTLHPDTEAAIAPSLDVFRKVSAERVRDEWIKTMKAPTPSRSFNVMRRTGIMGVTSPPLAALDDAAWSDAMAALDGCPGPAALRVAAMLHPLVAARGERDFAELGAWLTRLRFSNDERALVLHTLRHAKLPTPEADDAALRRWLREAGRAHLDEVFTLARTLAALRDEAGAVSALEARAQAQLRAGVALSTRELAVDGAALMAHLGIAPSKRLGQLLNALLERVTEDPSLNERAVLLDLARALEPSA